MAYSRDSNTEQETAAALLRREWEKRGEQTRAPLRAAHATQAELQQVIGNERLQAILNGESTQAIDIYLRHMMEVEAQSGLSTQEYLPWNAPPSWSNWIEPYYQLLSRLETQEDHPVGVQEAPVETTPLLSRDGAEKLVSSDEFLMNWFQRTVRRAGTGRSLRPNERSLVERVHGPLPEGIRIHEGDAAREAALGVQAKAFTMGLDIYFSNRADPGSAEGAELLVHEATHVKQAVEGRLPSKTSDGLETSAPNDPHEQEAYAAGREGRALQAKNAAWGLDHFPEIDPTGSAILNHLGEALPEPGPLSEPSESNAVLSREIKADFKWPNMPGGISGVSMSESGKLQAKAKEFDLFPTQKVTIPPGMPVLIYGIPVYLEFSLGGKFETKGVADFNSSGVMEASSFGGDLTVDGGIEVRSGMADVASVGGGAHLKAVVGSKIKATNQGIEFESGKFALKGALQASIKGGPGDIFEAKLTLMEEEILSFTRLKYTAKNGLEFGAFEWGPPIKKLNEVGSEIGENLNEIIDQCTEKVVLVLDAASDVMEALACMGITFGAELTNEAAPHLVDSIFTYYVMEGAYRYSAPTVPSGTDDPQKTKAQINACLDALGDVVYFERPSFTGKVLNEYLAVYGYTESMKKSVGSFGFDIGAYPELLRAIQRNADELNALPVLDLFWELERAKAINFSRDPNDYADDHAGVHMDRIQDFQDQVNASAAECAAQEPVQKKQIPGATDPHDAGATAREGVASASATLPYLQQIQAAFGRHRLKTVRAAVGGQAGNAAQSIGAKAYTMGEKVAFTNAGATLHTAAHEAAHVIQQRSGQVPNGMGRAGDAFEQHADAVADRVVAGESAEDLLDTFSTSSEQSASTSINPIQRDSDMDGSGEWDVRDAGGEDYATWAAFQGVSESAELMGLTNAARHMRHYLGNSGSDLHVDVDLMLRDLPELQEKFTLFEHRAYLRAIQELDQLDASKAHFLEIDGSNEKSSSVYAEKEVSPDWYFATGGFTHWWSAMVQYTPYSEQDPENPGGMMEIWVRMLYYDRYNWDKGKSVNLPVIGVEVTDESLGELHKCGLAQEFDMHGSSTDSYFLREYLTWRDSAEVGEDNHHSESEDRDGGRTDANRESGRSVQTKTDGSASTSGVDPQSGLTQASTGLPHQQKIQDAFGTHDLSGVKSQVGGRAGQAAKTLGAKAFASGESVAFRSGGADLHTAAHEAAHVIQQKSGSVPAGLGRPGDAFEKHADAVADKVVAGESAQGLLDQFSGGGGASKSSVQLQGDPSAYDSQYHSVEEKTESSATKSETTTTVEYGTGETKETDPEKREKIYKEALQADHEFWKKEVSRIETELETQKTEKKGLELTIAQASGQDQEAAVKAAEVSAAVGVLEGQLARAKEVAELRTQQVQQVESGELEASALKRDPRDPGIPFLGDRRIVQTSKKSWSIGGASVESETIKNGTQTTTAKAEATWDKELSAAYTGGSSTTDGDTTLSQKSTSKFQIKDDGVALTRSTSTTRKTGENSVTTDKSYTVEPDQLAVGVKQTRKNETEDKETGDKSSASFSYGANAAVKVEVKNDPDNEGYTLHASLLISGSVGLDTSAESGETGASAGTKKGLNGKLSWTAQKPISLDEAQIYTSEILEADEGGELPEFSFLESWITAISEFYQGEVGTTDTSDPSSVAALQVGESRSFSGEIDASTCFSGGLKKSGIGFAIKIEAGLGGKASHSIQRTSSGIQLTLACGTKWNANAKGEVTFEGMTVGLGAGVENASGASVTFVLDPESSDFAETYSELDSSFEDGLLAASSMIDRLLALRERYTSYVTAFELKQETTESFNAKGGTLGVNVSVSESTQRGTTRNEDGASSSGGSTTSVEIGAGETTVASGSIEETGTFEANESGVSAELDQTTTTTGLGGEASEWTLSKLWESLTGKGVHGALTERVLKTTTHLKRINVSPAAMEIFMTQRASDKRNWDATSVSVKSYQEWRDLRVALLSDSYRQDDAALYGTDIAINIARADVLADFMTLPDAYETVERALNRWGERIDTPSTAEDLGSYEEWPDAFASEEPKYKAIVAKAAGSESTLLGMSLEEEVREWVGDVVGELTRIQIILESNAEEWSDSRARLEMLSAIHDGLVAVREAKNNALLALGECDPDMVVSDDDPGDRTDNSGKIASKLSILRQYKSSEQMIFAQIREDQAEWIGINDWPELSAEYSNMVETWIREIKALRQLYTEDSAASSGAITPEVSMGSNDGRNSSLEPDISTYKKLIDKENEHSLVYGMWEDKALNTWLDNARTY